MKKNFSKIKTVFIGSAWPYANSSLHLGHIAALIGADILKRFFSQKKIETLWVSGSDCYGTPIAIEAQLLKKKPSEIASCFHQEFKKTFKKLEFSFDFYSKTTSLTHHKIVKKIFLDLLEKKLIYQKKQKQFFCPRCQRFLPDRFVEGICPYCKNIARGDQCDVCGALLEPSLLIEPYCRICKTKPVLKETVHFFFKLSAFQKQLISWIKKQKHWRKNAVDFSLGILKKGLKDRAISRDLEWGVKIPLKGFEGKVIYVWFEAVCGYLSASIEYSQKIGKPNFWKKFFLNEKSYHYYVFGKDNIPFHTIIWPSILLSQKLHLPDQIVSSEYLLLEGKKFSKSKKWMIEVLDFLKFFEPEFLRFYLIRINPEEADANFSFDDFFEKINKELIGNFGNYINRVLSFGFKNFKGEVFDFKKPTSKAQVEFLKEIEKGFFEVEDFIFKSFFKEALQKILEISQAGNRFLNQVEPWKKIKTSKEKVKDDLSLAIFSIDLLRRLIFPFLPKASLEISKLLGEKDLSLKFEKKKIKIVKKPKPLFKPIEKSQLLKAKQFFLEK